jgi:predicted nucleic acid-binding protein
VIAVDTNVIAYLLLPGPYSAAADQLRAMDADWVAPPLWRSELRNVMNMARRASQLDLPAALSLLDLADEVMRRADVLPDPRRVMQLAEFSGCTTYDCEFVEVAERRGLPLYTVDKKLLAAFPTLARGLPTN